MYLSRKINWLNKQGVQTVWVKPRNLFLLVFSLLKLRISYRNSVEKVEIHSAHFIFLLFLFLFGVDGRYHFYDHNYSSNFAGRGRVYIFLLKSVLARVGKVVIVSEHLKSNYLNIFEKEFIDGFVVETPYIPLSDDDEKGGDNLSVFFDFISNYKTYFVNSAWKLVDDENGNDLYGLIYSLETFLNVFPDDKNVAMVLIVGSDFNDKKEVLKNKIKDRTNVLILFGDYNLCSIINHGRSILLRTTSTDGDSLSVREALELNRKVIATDVVKRPSGVETCLYGSHEELSRLMKKLTEEY